MPTYDYLCRACGITTEVIHPMIEDGPSTCETCGGALRRVIFPSGIIFKGSGFYRNDSRASAANAADGSKGSEPAATDSTAKTGSDVAPSDAKLASTGSSSEHRSSEHGSSEHRSSEQGSSSEHGSSEHGSSEKAKPAGST